MKRQTIGKALLGLLLGIGGCTSDQDADNGIGLDGFSAEQGVAADQGPARDAGATDGSAISDGGLTSASVRVGNFSPDGPAFDLCVAPHGTASFTGPVLKGLGITAGLNYPQVTDYLPLPSGNFDVRAVSPNAADCNTPLAGVADATNLPSVSAGSFATLAVLGTVASGTTTPLQWKAFTDEREVAQGMIKLRLIHASPGSPSIDLGTGAATAFVPLFTNVAYSMIASGANIDANGYLQTNPLVNQTVTARASGTTIDALSVTNVNVPAGVIQTIFAIGQLANTKHPLKALVCVDNAPPASSHLATCSTMP